MIVKKMIILPPGTTTMFSAATGIPRVRATSSAMARRSARRPAAAV